MSQLLLPLIRYLTLLILLVDGWVSNTVLSNFLRLSIACELKPPTYDCVSRCRQSGITATRTKLTDS